MARSKITVASLATEAGIEVDEALIVLWDEGFDSISGPGDFFRKGDANRARRVLGLATRRELGSPEYWSELLGISADELSSLLTRLGVTKPYEGRRLSKRAISRLRGEARARGALERAQAVATPQAEGPIQAPVRFEWRQVGTVRLIEHLSCEEVTAIHRALASDLADDEDPIQPHGVRDKNLLESAVYHPHTALGDVPKYPTVEMAAAALFHALVHNHAFHNGNKRTALVSLLVFLNENGKSVTCDQDALFKLVLQLAQHGLVSGASATLADEEILAVADWILSNSRWIAKGDRPIPFRRLRTILSRYGCEVDRPTSGSVIIRRTKPNVRRSRGLFSRSRAETLATQTYYGGEGREVDRGSMRRIRRDLELDEESGIDSAAFYDDAVTSVSDFITRYQRILTRLSRL